MKNQYIIFTLNQDSFGIDINMVKEIASVQPVVSVPDIGEYVTGIISFREKVVPVIDMKKMLNMKTVEMYQRLIVVENNGVLLAMLVDKASETISIDEDEINLSDQLVNGLIYGVSKRDDRLILLVGLERMIEKANIQMVGKLC